jgi:hypothetical protein
MVISIQKWYDLEQASNDLKNKGITPKAIIVVNTCAMPANFNKIFFI